VDARTPTKRQSAFAERGLTQCLATMRAEVREIYEFDAVPWVLGYSGGKDSTAALQLVWTALEELPPERRKKPVHVISTDTLVENPIVASWVSKSLEAMKDVAQRAHLPIVPHRLTPEVSDTYWVNLIGKGYPAPRNKFRWCTERLKIKPSNRFIRNVVRDNGEAILVLGTRKAESATRAKNMERHGEKAIRARLTPNAALLNSLIYTPLEEWTNDDVWLFLMQVSNPWGYNNKDLLTMYRGATADGECPLVVDTSTPSCGNSRFGCWVCTLVDQDKSMAAMIQNDDEKEWMLPLLDLRNELDFRTEDDRARDRERRDFRRFSGRLDFYTDRDGEIQLIPGPYTQNTRVDWLRRLLRTQRRVRQDGPLQARNLELITLRELDEIRRIWVVEKHETEDYLPTVYREEMGSDYPGRPLEDRALFGRDVLEILRECCGDDDLHYQLARNLLDIERKYRTMAARRGLFKSLEEEVERHFYDGRSDALLRARERAALRAASEGGTIQGGNVPSGRPRIVADTEATGASEP